MKIDKFNSILTVLLIAISVSVFFLTKPHAEQGGDSPDSGVDSIIKEGYDDLVVLGVGSDTGQHNTPMWNRITSFTQTPLFRAQSLQAKDFQDQGDAFKSWSIWTKTNTSPEVWRDERTGLYWSASQGTATNSFTISTCPFFTATPRGSYMGGTSACGNAINLCGALSLSPDGGSAKSDWYLPTQAELMQAYLDGMYLSTSTSWVTTSNFWSSTEYQSSSSNAWSTYLSYGYTLYNSKTANKYVRCVRRD